MPKDQGKCKVKTRCICLIVQVRLNNIGKRIVTDKFIVLVHLCYSTTFNQKYKSYPSEQHTLGSGGFLQALSLYCIIIYNVTLYIYIYIYICIRIQLEYLMVFPIQKHTCFIFIHSLINRYWTILHFFGRALRANFAKPHFVERYTVLLAPRPQPVCGTRLRFLLFIRFVCCTLEAKSNTE